MTASPFDCLVETFSTIMRSHCELTRHNTASYQETMCIDIRKIRGQYSLTSTALLSTPPVSYSLVLNIRGEQLPDKVTIEMR